MFWNDIDKLKKEIEGIKDYLEAIFCSEDEYSSINRIHDKLNSLIEDADRQQAVLLAEKTLDKFEDYMKNIDKLNSLVNEFKGCVSLARGALEERKELDRQTQETKKLAEISQKIYESMLSFIKAGENLEAKAYFKIDAIYKALCEDCEKKSRKTPKKPKK